jgi:alpha-L-arabinofuranosidase
MLKPNIRETMMPQPAIRSAAARALVLAGICAGALTARAGTTVTVDLSKPGPTLPPMFYGLMTEEINHSYDGGLYAELVQNRTFQDPGKSKDGLPPHWSKVGAVHVAIDDADPVNAALPKSLRLDLTGGSGGIANDGYWGIPVKPSTTYTATFYAKAAGGFAGPVTAALLTNEGDVTVAKADTPAITGEWNKYTVTLKTSADSPTTAKARFMLSASGSGSVSFSYVSLFPPTYQDHSNGLRPDLMKLMAGLKPKFIRLPGGNYVEGGRFSDRFNWKEMIGPADQRPGHMGCWSYRSSDGFGMPEYLLWCKQLNAEPVLAVFAGYTLNHDYVKAGSPEMAIYTQEALQEIEYVTGSADSEWGKKRAADGFPEPFPLRYVEIGNEDWFDKSGSYDGRFTQIAKAIREKYPQLKLIATAPVKSFKPDLYDDHYYAKAGAMARMAQAYDKAGDGSQQAGQRRLADGTKIFVGEWATQEGQPTPTLNAALADAAFFIGLEKNADVVEMQCYAPLLANVNPADPAKGYPRGWQWPTNMIGYDALGSFGSPSYYAQVMLSQNLGDVVLPTVVQSSPTTIKADPVPSGAIGLGAWHTQAEYKDILVTSPDGKPLQSIDLAADKAQPWQFTGGQWDIGNGVIKAPSGSPESWAITGDAKWGDYDVTLKARKISGDEGFIVLFHAADGGNYRWWNVGGWGNTATRLEVADNGQRTGWGPDSNFTVDTGRWYDLRIEVRGRRFRGYVDGRLVTEADESADPSHARNASVLASATYDHESKAIIVKAVNTGGQAVDATINLAGVGKVESAAKVIVLSGGPGDTNSVSEPQKVAPKEEAMSVSGPTLNRSLPAHSLTIIRVPAELPKS